MSNMATNHTQYIKQEIKKVLKSLISNTSSRDWVGLFTFNIRPHKSNIPIQYITGLGGGVFSF